MEKAMVLNQIQQRLKPKESFFLDLSGESSKPAEVSKPVETVKPELTAQPVATSKAAPVAAQKASAAKQAAAGNEGKADQSLLRTVGIIAGALLFSLGGGLLVGRIINPIAGVVGGVIVLLVVLLGASVLGLLGQQKPAEPKAEKIEVATAPKSVSTPTPPPAPVASEPKQKQQSPAKFQAKKPSASKTKESTQEAQPTPATETTSPQPQSPERDEKESAKVADEIAAQLASDLEAQPEQIQATYAPEKLTPGNAISPRRRQPGADIKGFKQMADELFKR